MLVYYTIVRGSQAISWNILLRDYNYPNIRLNVILETECHKPKPIDPVNNLAMQLVDFKPVFLYSY